MRCAGEALKGLHRGTMPGRKAAVALKHLGDAVDKFCGDWPERPAGLAITEALFCMSACAPADGLPKENELLCGRSAGVQCEHAGTCDVYRRPERRPCTECTHTFILPPTSFSQSSARAEAQQLPMHNHAAAHLLASRCSLQAASCSCVPCAGQRRQAARFWDPSLISNANLLPYAFIISSITARQVFSR